MMAKVINDTGLGHETKLLLDDGREVKGITRLTYTAMADNYSIIKADIACGQIEAEGIVRFYAANPETSETSEVSKIVFADGAEWIAP